MKKHIFIIGLDDHNLKKLKNVRMASECEFHPALYVREMREVQSFPIQEIIDKTIERIRSAGTPVDAVVAFYDFPAMTIQPIVAEEFGVRSSSLESVLKCEHKLWSRQEQAKVIPQHTPKFQGFDPFEDNLFDKIDLIPPYWVKPIKSFSSYLAFHINDREEFEEHLEDTRENIHYIVEPFCYLLKEYDMPEEVAESPKLCLAETLLSGWQCTLEGYVFENEIVTYGIIDSVRRKDRSSFSRYQYPSSLPNDVQSRMADIVHRIVEHIGLNNTQFNIEFFYNSTQDEIHLLEINPRMAQAHADLFEKVHGISHQEILLKIALGERPEPLKEDGPFNVAANFMLRTYHNGKVMSVPQQEAISQLKEHIPGLTVQLAVKEGQKLSDLHSEDSYSYKLANITLGGEDEQDLMNKYNWATHHLIFEITDVEA